VAKYRAPGDYGDVIKAAFDDTAELDAMVAGMTRTDRRVLRDLISDIEAALDQADDDHSQDRPSTLAEDRRDAFIDGALWADDSCPVHKYPSLVRAEAEKRYTQGPT
jgi:hypothetical protein